MKKVIFLLSFVWISTGSAVAQQVKIIKCNTPTVSVGGKELGIGSSFDKESTIKWSSPSQVVMVRNSDGRIIRLAAKLSDNGSQDLVSKLLQKQYAHLSSRGDERPGGEYYMEDTLKLPIDLEEGFDIKLELVCKEADRTFVYTPSLIDNGKYALIRENVFDGVKEHRIECRLVGKIDEDVIELSDLIYLIPLDYSFENN